MYSNILKKVTTVSERDKLLADIEAGRVREWFAAEVEGNKEEFLNGLRKELEVLKVMRLELAYRPSAEDAAFYHDWVLGNLGEGILLDFFLEPEVIAGAVISFEGKYFDYSVKRKLSSK